MTKYVINGGKTLNGEVTISGAKNAAVAIVPAALLADGPVRLENVPKIIDVTLQMEIMRELGAQIRQINATTVEIQNTQNPSLKPHELERKLRASYYLLGVLLGKYGFAEVAMPGGCNFGGVRPIDQHIKGFEALGAKVTLPKGGYIRVEAPEDGLHGAHIYCDVVTVGAPPRLPWYAPTDVPSTPPLSSPAIPAWLCLPVFTWFESITSLIK